MYRRLTRIALAAALTLTAVAGFAGAARADTVVMGSTLASDFDNPGFSATAPIVSAQIAFDPATSRNPVVSPVDGVISSWKVKSADDGVSYTLEILRPTGPVSLVVATDTNFAAISSVQAPSAVPAGTALANPKGVVFTYPASLPISKGDYIGLRATGLSPNSNLPQHVTSGLDRNLIANNFSGLPTDANPAPLKADKQHELLLQATIEFTPTPPGNPASPVNPAGNVRKRKCKKKTKHRSAHAAKKKSKKQCKNKKGKKTR